LGVELNEGTGKGEAADESFVAGPASPALMGTKLGLLIQVALKKKREAVSFLDMQGRSLQNLKLSSGVGVSRSPRVAGPTTCGECNKSSRCTQQQLHSNC
jgi:hypothetical protein